MTIATASYDLLTEPWVPAVASDGRTAELGLLETLEKAHDLRQIADPSPLATFSIHRFLAAVLHTYLKLEDYDEWAAAWDTGQFDPNLVERIRAGCKERLRLFDSDFPFYQSSDIPITIGGGLTKTVGYLALDASTGTNVVHFSHPGDGEHAFCPSCCAKGLVALPPFATSGGAGIFPSINGVPPLYLMPSGENLFATLMLNYVLPEYQPKLAVSGSTRPLWEGSGVVQAREIRASATFVESLTWPPRKVRLIPSGGGVCSRCKRGTDRLVRRMVFGQGWLRDREAPVWDDPWVAYEIIPDKKRGTPARKCIRLKENRATWRDFTGLFLSQEGMKTLGMFQSPRVILQLATLMREEYLPRQLPVSFQVFGLRTDMKAKVFEGRADTFSFPPAILLMSDAMREVQAALERAEDAGRHLAGSLCHLNPEFDQGRGGQLKPGDWEPIRHAGREYWQSLEPRFREAMANQRLTGDTAARAEWSVAWRKAARESAVSAFERAIDGFDGTAEMLRRRQKASDQFYRATMARRGGDR